ncbi:MAG TPA: magnesium transporter [Candidatus Alectryocaccobium stercorigallinarum]|nr:magnesium transporter [Candidatus Alectryocaccobium stercorigallinarum]
MKMTNNFANCAINEKVFQTQYAKTEIGSRITKDFVSVKQGMNICQATRSLIDQAGSCENISTIYVTDDEGRFAGAVDLNALITARKDTELSSITQRSFPYMYAHEHIEDCIEKLVDYSEDSLPVLDDDKKLIGILTAQTLVQLVDDEFGDDYAKLGGLPEEEDLNEPVKMSIRKRLPWLIILLGLGLIVSSVVGAFESVVASLTIIISFQSLILDMAGNAGTQSLAVTIRVLTSGDLDREKKLKFISKETRVGLINGTILGIMSFGLVGLYLLTIQHQPSEIAFSVSFCTAAALLISIILSSAIGAVTPIIFKKLNFDPAAASGPLITTLNDLVAVVAYYGLAWVFLINVLHL